MLLLIALWAGLLPTFAMIGLGIASRFPSFHRFPRPDRLLLSVWLGLLLILNVLLAVSLLRPLTPAVGAAVLGTLSSAGLWSRAVRHEIASAVRALNGSHAVGLFAILAGSAALAAKQVTWYDSGLYHYGVVQWLSDFGSVPGLALIHSRFGVASSWYTLPAPFDAGPLTTRLSALGGGLAVFLATTHAVVALSRLLQGRAWASDLLQSAAIALLLPLMLWMGASPSPDLPVVALTVLIAWVMQWVIETGDQPSRGSPPVDIHLIPAILAVGAVTIKLSALPLLVVTLLFAARYARWSPRVLLPGALAIGAALLPAALYGARTSGCAFFPAGALCAQVPWSVGAQVADRDAAIIQSWARWDGSAPASASAWNWIGPWIERHPLTAFLVVASIVASVDLIRAIARGRAKGAAWVLVLGALTQMFVLYMAPAPRFLAAPAALLPGLWLAHSGNATGAWTRRIVARTAFESSFRWVSVAAGLGIFGAALLLNLTAESIAGRISVSQLAIPPRMNAPEQLVAKRSGSFAYWSPGPRDDRCWAAALPCTPYAIDPDVAMIDPVVGIGAGFGRFPSLKSQSHSSPGLQRYQPGRVETTAPTVTSARRQP